MKNYAFSLFALLLAFGTFEASAQAIDMNLTSPNITPAPALFPGKVTITFNITAEILDQQLSSDDLGSSFASVTISLSDLQGSTSLIPSGAGGDMFNWTYNAATNSYTGFSKDVLMTADVIYPITLENLPTTKVTTDLTVGFLANLNPPGDLLASESNDDAASIYTRADLNLPVTLVSFNAAKEGGVVMLRWATTEETNSDYFEVQHSTNGKNWAKIGMVKSHGESTVLRNYDFTHQSPAGGQNLYRLKMVDKDLTFAYSAIRDVRLEGSESIAYVYPNPVVDRLFIKDSGTGAEVNIYDTRGMKVYHGEVPQTGELNMKNFSNGIYVVNITRANGTETSQKIIVSK
ncbi:MAG: T9SS type A sorting domain-containing protein [Dyadobacter sp.]|uniref:T9SS type A sorting domain-containing protein n=1 Tax=Dyadobacter sp. TaxID=1914288 RepID=UPI001B20181D|nr:T9SS type A sorting domain-containing protein [Dyadobacter sp.]MBO9611353.1 T9SS type A sorting domain-containing protein [Dyadobacter sp.]